MTIMYRTSCVSKEDIGIIFVPNYKNNVVQSHTMTLKECIDLYCNDFNINYNQYYLKCGKIKTQ
jgi:hypothetical protein